MNFQKLFYRVGLKSEIIIVTTAVIVLTTVASTAFFYVKTRSIIFESVSERGNAICTNLSLIAKKSIPTEDKTALDEPVIDTMRYADIVYVVITNNRGNILAEKTTVKIPDTVEIQRLAIQTQQRQSSFCKDSLGNPIYNFCYPVTVGKTCRGTIQIGLSLQDITTRLSDMLRCVIALSVAIVGCGIIFSINFVRFIMKPIQQMADAATKIAEGDLTQTIEVQSPDEFGHFARQFNIMTAALKDRERQLKESYEELSASEERYRVFIQNSSESIWCFEHKDGKVYPAQGSEDEIIKHLLLDSIVVECNDATANIYNAKRREELLGRPLSDFLSPSDPERIEHFRSFIRNGYRLTNAERHYADGQEQTRIIDTSLLGTTDNGKLLRVWVIQRDITDIRCAEHIQTQLFAKIQETNQELKEFAYVASHDLKAPLRGIKTLAEWISKDYADKFDETGKAQLKLLTSRVDRMHNLIDGILQYSKIGRVQENPVSVNLNDIIPEVIDTITPPANIEIVYETALPTILFEETRLRQVFQNLIGNAVKYMDKPKGRISIGCTDEGDRWKFNVTDNGPGIEKKYYEKIFKIFQTLKPRDEYESTGIGLTIVKKIIELYGGTVWVESKIGQGSTFFFTVRKKYNAPINFAKIQAEIAC